jgi:hypothetical protein
MATATVGPVSRPQAFFNGTLLQQQFALVVKEK